VGAKQPGTKEGKRRERARCGKGQERDNKETAQITRSSKKKGDSVQHINKKWLKESKALDRGGTKRCKKDRLKEVSLLFKKQLLHVVGKNNRGQIQKTKKKKKTEHCLEKGWTACD